VTASYARPALNTIQREDEECDGMGGRGGDGNGLHTMSQCLAALEGAGINSSRGGRRDCDGDREIWMSDNCRVPRGAQRTKPPGESFGLLDESSVADSMAPRSKQHSSNGRQTDLRRRSRSDWAV